jgi:hypothetical protein
VAYAGAAGSSEGRGWHAWYIRRNVRCGGKFARLHVLCVGYFAAPQRVVEPGVEVKQGQVGGRNGGGEGMGRQAMPTCTYSAYGTFPPRSV